MGFWTLKRENTLVHFCKYNRPSTASTGRLKVLAPSTARLPTVNRLYVRASACRASTGGTAAGFTFRLRQIIGYDDREGSTAHI